jgi:hypothetical protein
MASIPTLNRTIRFMPETKPAQAWQPLCTEAGVAIDTTRRTLVADVIARLCDVHMQSNPKASFATVSGGLRFVQDSMSGAGSPLFVENKGAAMGTIYVFNGATKKDGLLSALEGCIESVRDEGGSKAGLYLTLKPDCDVEHVHKVLSLHASVRGPVGYRSDMGPASDCEGATFDPATLPAREPKVEKVAKDPAAPKAKRGRPKGSTNKAKETVASEPSTEQAAS